MVPALGVDELGELFAAVTQNGYLVGVLDPAGQLLIFGLKVTRTRGRCMVMATMDDIQGCERVVGWRLRLWEKGFEG